MSWQSLSVLKRRTDNTMNNNKKLHIAIKIVIGVWITTLLYMFIAPSIGFVYRSTLNQDNVAIELLRLMTLILGIYVAPLVLVPASFITHIVAVVLGAKDNSPAPIIVSIFSTLFNLMAIGTIYLMSLLIYG